MYQLRPRLNYNKNYKTIILILRPNLHRFQPRIGIIILAMTADLDLGIGSSWRLVKQPTICTFVFLFSLVSEFCFLLPFLIQFQQIPDDVKFVKSNPIYVFCTHWELAFDINESRFEGENVSSILWIDLLSLPMGNNINLRLHAVWFAAVFSKI